jgi:hypothetical protein
MLILLKNGKLQTLKENMLIYYFLLSKFITIRIKTQAKFIKFYIFCFYEIGR